MAMEPPNNAMEPTDRQIDDPEVSSGHAETENSIYEPGRDYWTRTDVSDEQRNKFIAEMDALYQSRLTEFINTSNLCGQQFARFSKSHHDWRWIVIIGTGAVAVFNVVAAYLVNSSVAFVAISAVSIFAAVAAAILAILANLENFSNSLEKAQNYREARDLFLDAARDYERQWRVGVRAIAPSAEASLNAIELYKRVTEADRELRGKLKQLTIPRESQ